MFKQQLLTKTSLSNSWPKKLRLGKNGHTPAFTIPPGLQGGRCKSCEPKAVPWQQSIVLAGNSNITFASENTWCTLLPLTPAAENRREALKLDWTHFPTFLSNFVPPDLQTNLYQKNCKFITISSKINVYVKEALWKRESYVSGTCQPTLLHATFR